MTDFELDFEKISETRTTIKDVITASHQVTGDMIYSDNPLIINPSKRTVGDWDFSE